jgi:HSP20 family protein
MDNQRRFIIMSIMRPFSSMVDEINQLFNEMERGLYSPQYGRSRGRMRQGGRTGGVGGGGDLESVWAPPVDVIEEDNQVVVRALVPGVQPDTLEIEAENDTLSLTGQTTMDMPEESQGNYHMCELPSGRIYRKVPLPAHVQSDKAQARFENGLLTVILPKSEESRRHRIQVKGK